MNEQNDKEPTLQQFFLDMTDLQKLDFIGQLAAVMSPEFRQTVINELARETAANGGEITINVSGDDKTVRIDFGKALAWCTMPKAHAVQLAMNLLQAAGAQVQPAAPPGNGPPPIDVKPL